MRVEGGTGEAAPEVGPGWWWRAAQGLARHRALGALRLTLGRWSTPAESTPPPACLALLRD
jgi:hypothetical protein